jgi:hypothetical protein
VSKWSPAPPSISARLWKGAFALFGASLLVWLAVQLIAQVWGWLVLLVALGLAVFGLVRWHHSRIRRW